MAANDPFRSFAIAMLFSTIAHASLLGAMIMRHAIISAVLCGLTLIASADEERTPVPLVFASPLGAFYFRLVSSSDFDEENAKGFLYRVSDEGDELLYQSNGWYSFTVLVSDNGAYLARTGPWPRFDSPPESTSAVVFYADGVPVRTYFVADLVDDLSKLQYSESHYGWGGSLRWTEEQWKGEVEVKTVENKTIRFNIQTAEIVN